MNKSELIRLERYLRQTFRHDALRVVKRPSKDDSAEVYLGEEFLGVLFRDDEDGEVSYQFNMAILDIDLDPEG
ncbi:MAG: DUF3126 family protein [Alphaproteobacteria bacterium]|nr:DUF3126 family protein [Alphaproteobacteria bacterium]